MPDTILGIVVHTRKSTIESERTEQFQLEGSAGARRGRVPKSCRALWKNVNRDKMYVLSSSHTFLPCHDTHFVSPSFSALSHTPSTWTALDYLTNLCPLTFVVTHLLVQFRTQSIPPRRPGRWSISLLIPVWQSTSLSLFESMATGPVLIWSI
jgi:hypothetical protein